MSVAKTETFVYGALWALGIAVAAFVVILIIQTISADAENKRAVEHEARMACIEARGVWLDVPNSGPSCIISGVTDGQG